MKLLLMADSTVGLAVARWLFSEYRGDVSLVVTTAENDVWMAAQHAGVPYAILDSADRICALIQKLGVALDLGVLAWWPNIIKQPLLSKPRLGFINTHPSLLPSNRGKHYNFWAIVEQAPFGVSLHMVNDDVDSGDIIAQMPIPYGWEDNGETLYLKATEAMVRLFRDTYPIVRTLDFRRQQQDLRLGSFHRAAELDAASHIELERSYRARDLLNLLRARTFAGRPSCWFNDRGELFEVRIDIKRKES